MAEGRRFVVGDIHGCVKTFRALVMEKIKLAKEDTLFLLGDYIDRGPDSKGVLDFIMQMQAESYIIRPIIGNHEYMMLRSLEDEDEFISWKKNGSAQTLMSFGIPEEETQEIGSVRKVPAVYFDFLNGLSFFEETDDFYFVHAGLAKGIEEPKEDIETLLWSRKEQYNRTILKGRILVHGHTPVTRVSIMDRVFDGEVKIFNLDGGCVYPHVEGFGHLAGMNLDTFDLIFQKNVE